MKFVCISTHPEDLSHGQVVAPGEDVTLTAEQVKNPHNAVLLDPDAKKFVASSSKGEEAAQKAAAAAHRHNQRIIDDPFFGEKFEEPESDVETVVTHTEEGVTP